MTKKERRRWSAKESSREKNFQWLVERADRHLSGKRHEINERSEFMNDPTKRQRRCRSTKNKFNFVGCKKLYAVLKVLISTFNGLVAQLVRAPPCHGGGRGFESLLGRFIIIWDLSSAGRASALQAEGHRFEPCRSHSCRRGGTGRRAGLKILLW